MTTNLGAGLCESGWSEGYDCVPLRTRLKMLRARVLKPDNDAGIAAVSDFAKEECKSALKHTIDHKEDGNLNAEFDYDKQMLQMEKFASSIIPVGTFTSLHHRTSDSGSEARADVVGEQQLNKAIDAILHPMSSDVCCDVNIPPRECVAGSNSAHVQGIKVKHEIVNEFDGELDNVVLRDRRRRLISRKLVEPSGSNMGEHGKCGGLYDLSKVKLESAGIEMPESNSVQDMLSNKNTSLRVSCCDQQTPKSGTNSCPGISIESRSSPTLGEFKSYVGQEVTVRDADAIPRSASSCLTRVKDEPIDIADLWSEGNSGMQNFFNIEMQTVKSEASLFLEDKLDHLPLIDRVKLLSSGTPSLDEPQKFEFHSENVGSALDIDTHVLESVKPVSISRPRKRRRTATDSVETALEEDAPGLLKVLIERGISPQEIKLYGEEEAEDTLDDSLTEDGFSELEAVISQLFSQRQPFLKFPLLRCTKGAKASYCLSCLLSLVEQTIYLRNRNWPVEWGWCRDLQSFIFVFPRHNRIVMERPEYGYATYFFELLHSVPVEWQIRRLVIAMKLTSCGRITLIENKPLLVGEDLSEGEARVLAEYGWTPNTGLGTMLNFCDRVLHDRKQEMDSSEWRSKIARQLVNGYNGGNIVSKTLPKKLVEYQDSQSLQVKLEQ